MPALELAHLDTADRGTPLGGMIGTAPFDTGTQEIFGEGGHIVHGLRTDDQVEWGWESGAFIKVTHPQLGAGKLPLHVSMVLEYTNSIKFLVSSKTPAEQDKVHVPEKPNLESIMMIHFFTCRGISVISKRKSNQFHQAHASAENVKFKEWKEWSVTTLTANFTREIKLFLKWQST